MQSVVCRTPYGGGRGVGSSPSPQQKESGQGEGVTEADGELTRRQRKKRGVWGAGVGCGWGCGVWGAKIWVRVWHARTAGGPSSGASCRLQPPHQSGSLAPTGDQETQIVKEPFEEQRSFSIYRIPKLLR